MEEIANAMENLGSMIVAGYPRGLTTYTASQVSAQTLNPMAPTFKPGGSETAPSQATLNEIDKVIEQLSRQHATKPDCLISLFGGITGLGNAVSR